MTARNSRQMRLVKTLFRSDQRQRLTGSSRLELDDSVRFAFASLIAKSSHLSLDPASRYRLGMLLHHAGAYQLGRHVARPAIGGHPKALWLVCAIIDRQRLVRGQEQLAGTQYRASPSGELALAHPVITIE